MHQKERKYTKEAGVGPLTKKYTNHLPVEVERQRKPNYCGFKPSYKAACCYIFQEILLRDLGIEA